MKPFAGIRALVLLVSFLLLNPGNSRNAQAGGVTLITHGLNSNVDDWVSAMANQMTAYARFPGTNFTCYKLYFISSGSDYALTWMRVRGDSPSATDSGEIMVLLDWRQLATGTTYTTYDVAGRVVPCLLQTNFISELGGHALVEMPIHLVGHSRGGSLVCQISQLLGTNGVWVDHLTTLDPHPLNNDGFYDIIYRAVDAPCRTYENVLYHDNYYQLLDSLFYGEAIAGAYVRQLTSLNGGYSGLGGAHSDVHLWYHGTADWRVPASDSSASITSTERQTWWTTNESTGFLAGFYYSLIGGGDRFATNRPVATKNSRIVDGYNQRWNFGAGNTNNRTALTANNGGWPNPIQCQLSGTNLVAYGETNAVKLYYQWARPATSNAVVSLYLDDDFNPFNGNGHLVHQFVASGTEASQVNASNIVFNLNSTNAAPGYHTLYAGITAGGRTRYLYAPEMLTVVSSWEPPRLEVAKATAGEARVQVGGIPGQRFVLQATDDLLGWRSLSTNWLSTNYWLYVDGLGPRRFYRAVLQ